MESSASFGYWLQRSRKALGLTQAELGQRIGCSAAALRKIEASERRPSREIAERLAQHLGIPPDQQSAFVQFARSESSAPPQTITRSTPTPWHPTLQPPTQLPIPPTPLIGRAREVAAVCEILSRPEVRLVTLIGPGGIGKTRLSLQVAHDMASAFRDGVVFVPLAPLTDASGVLTAISKSVGVQQVGSRSIREVLLASLQQRHLLLILDNFEHLMGAATDIAGLLAGCEQLHILATSREPLHLSAEYEWPVPLLAVPAAGDETSLDTLVQHDSVRLFLQRAQAINRDLQLTPTTAAAIAQICVGLDGLPLAIELAAARCKVMSVQQLAARLQDRLNLLTTGARDVPDRQQTLRKAIDWSYQLLSSEEQQLFARLSIFAGGWTMEAAEAVCGTDHTINVLDGLQSLIDKSLVQQALIEEDEPRFLMLETIREYAVERLHERGEYAHTGALHTQFYIALVAKAEARRESTNLPLLAHEHANIQSALARCIEQRDATSALQLATGIAFAWIYEGHLVEARHWLATAVALPPQESTPLHAKAYGLIGGIAWRQGDYASAERNLTIGLELFKACGTVEDVAWLDFNLAKVYLEQARYEQAVAQLVEGEQLFQQIGHKAGLAWSRFGRGELLISRADYAGAAREFEASLPLFRAWPSTIGIAWALLRLGEARLAQNDPAALALLRESLERFASLHEQSGIAAVLDGLAGWYLLDPQPHTDATRADHVPANARAPAERAVMLLAAAATIRAETGAKIPRFYHDRYQQILDRARAATTAGEYAQAWAMGCRSVREIIAAELDSNQAAEPPQQMHRSA